MKVEGDGKLLRIFIGESDRAERIDAILPTLDAMVTEGMLTVEPIHIIAYRAGEDPDGAAR
jgi:PII-like signaling protein